MNEMPASDSTAGPGVLVPERRISAPNTVSPAAQAFLNNPIEMNRPAPSDPNDKAAWRAYIAEGDLGLREMMAVGAASSPCEIIEHRVGEATLYELIPPTFSAADAKRAIYYLHGGGFIVGSGITAAYMAQPLASVSGLTTLSIDYRMPPDHPFPVGLDDAVAGYRAALERFAPENIVVAGASADGGLAASLILKIRDLGLPMPAACVLGTPEVDLTESGDTFETNAEIDIVLRRRLTESIAVYAAGHNLRDPYLSPLFADFSQGFVPTLLLSGTRDLFLSNTVRMHRLLCKAGIEAELHIWEAMPHGGFFGAPEDREVLDQQASFIRKHIGAG